MESPEERAEKEKNEAQKAEQVETTETVAETVVTDKEETHISPWGNDCQCLLRKKLRLRKKSRIKNKREHALHTVGRVFTRKA